MAVTHDAHTEHRQSWLTRYIFSQDHKVIGIQYLFTSMIMAVIGGFLAMLIRMQLGFPTANFYWAQWLFPGGFSGNYVEDFFLNRLDAAVHPYFETISGLQVSSHFYIRRDGRVIQFVSADDRAWHAGPSRWCERENCNDWSVGIELEGTDDLAFEAAQYAALWALLAALCQRYPLTDIAGHSHIAPGRKTDPGRCFDWGAAAARFPGPRLPRELAA